MKTVATEETHQVHPPVDEQNATIDGLISVVEDRPAVRVPNLLTDEYCTRCDHKADVYQAAGLDDEVDLRSGWLQDGERIRFFAWFNADPDDSADMKGWEIRSFHHIDHIEKDIEDIAHPGRADATATATLDRIGCEYTDFWPDGDSYEVEDRSVLRDVQVEAFSPIGYGSEPEPIREPDEYGMVELKHTDPRPNFPEELNRWREDLLKANDAWTTTVQPEQPENINTMFEADDNNLIE